VSSLGPRWPAALEPRGLDAPLTWLAAALQAQDEARLEWLWSAGVKLDVLERCVAAFARRYPETPAAAQYRQRLRALTGRRRRRPGSCLAGVRQLPHRLPRGRHRLRPALPARHREGPARRAAGPQVAAGLRRAGVRRAAHLRPAGAAGPGRPLAAPLPRQLAG